MNLQKSIEECYSQVYFLIREGLYCRTQKYCEECYKQFNDPFFIFWKAFGLMKEKRIPEAINELQVIMNKREIQYSVLSLLCQLHEQSQLVDEDQLDSIKFQWENSKSGASDKALVLAARQMTYSDKMDEAWEILEEIRMAGKDVLIARGWLLYERGDPESLQQGLEVFRQVLGEQSNHLEGLLGLGRSLQKMKQYGDSLDAINEVLVYYQNNVTVQVEKALVLMVINDWDQCLEVVGKVLYEEPDNLIAKKIELFHQLAVQGDSNTFLMGFSQFIQSIKEQESKNQEFMFEVSRLFARMCGRHAGVLKLTSKLLEECRRLSPLSCDVVIEMGYQSVIVGDFKAAYQFYQEAAALDETRLEALTGMIECRIHQGEFEDAANQIEFVNEIQLDGKISQVAYLEALLANKKQDHQMAGKSLDQALKLHIQMTKSLPSGFSFFIKLDPDYLIQLASQYQVQLTLNALLEKDSFQGGHIAKGNKLLETVLKQVPGHIAAHLLLARGKLALNDQAKAQDSLQKVDSIQSTNQDMYILNALLMLHQGNERSALNSLQQSIASNFQIRENILFLLIKGKIELQLKDYQAAIQTLEEAIQILEGGQKTQKTQETEVFSFGADEKCMVYTSLAKAYGSNKQLDKARDVINNTIAEFAGSPQEINVLLANSQLAIESNDIKKALSILRAVSSDSPYYSQSRKLMADVYLTQLKDRRNYSKCYTDLVESNPSGENYKMLGKAMLTIQEPQEALAAFTEAQNFIPNDSEVVMLLGKSLTMGHYYQKAIQYYQNILSTHNNLEFILEIGQLLMKTKRTTEAEQYLRLENFVDEFNNLGLSDMRTMVKGLECVHELQIRKQGTDNLKSNTIAQQALEKAIYFQGEVIDKCKQSGISFEGETTKVGWLYYTLGKHMHLYESNSQVALTCMDRATKYLGDNEKIMSLIVEIYWKNNERALCEAKCQQLLKFDGNSDYGTFLYSELLIQKQQEQQAIDYFRNMFYQKNNNYRLLSRLIQLESRFGDISKVESYIRLAEKNTTNVFDQGLCFCRGIYYKQINESEKALVEFNKSKRASEYREQSVYQMIITYLNPQNELWINQTEQANITVSKDVIDCCEQLLKELYENTRMYKFLQVIIQVIDPSNTKMDNQIQILTDLCKDNTHYVPGTLFLAVSKYSNKKNTEAKNHLKILSKKSYNSEFHDELEMSWLIYADTFISISKYDNAEEILKKCLKYNRSCAKAEEFMGLIKEKESSYIDAATHYEKAFSLTNQKNLPIGYRLAFNYLKAKRYIECVDICNKILKISPDYPKVQKEILSFARQKIRS